MANLGAIGLDHLAGQRHGIVVNPWRPIGGIRTIPGRATEDMVPLFNPVSDPVAVAGTIALECYTAGTFLWYAPVEANATYAFDVYLRKTSGYLATLGAFRAAPISLLPYMTVTRSDGQIFRATMSDVTDTWNLVTVTAPILTQGVATVRVVLLGLPGTSGFFAGRTTLPQRFVTKAWINRIAPRIL